MRLTSAYSLVRADQEFDWEKPSKLPREFQERRQDMFKAPAPESGSITDKLKGVDPYQAFEESGLADPYLYEDKPYRFTGKFGVNFKSHKTAFEYSYMNDAEESEERIWVDEDGEVSPD